MAAFTEDTSKTIIAEGFPRLLTAQRSVTRGVCENTKLFPPLGRGGEGAWVATGANNVCVCRAGDLQISSFMAKYSPDTKIACNGARVAQGWKCANVVSIGSVVTGWEHGAG